MERDELMAEIKKMLEEELKAYVLPLQDKLQEKIQEHIPQAGQEKAKEWHHSITSAIKDNPLQCVALAMIAGFMRARLIYKESDKENT